MSNPIDIQNAIALLHGEGYKIEPTESKIKFAYYGGDYNYSIKWGKPIDKEDFPKIEEAISKVLNGELDNPAPIPQEDKSGFVFNYDAIKERMKELKDCKWVKSKRGGSLRFVTRKISDKLFEDDGLISGQAPSQNCHYDSYEDLTKDEEIGAWCGYMARQPIQFSHTAKMYTQSEVDTIREETWVQARMLTIEKPITGYMGTGLKYPNLQDYLQSLPTNTVTDNSDVPCLSLNDLLDVWDGGNLTRDFKSHYKDSPLYKLFEQKVKEKLKK